MPADRLRELASRLGDAFGVLFVALSYRWLTPAHPDPDGFHLATVAEVAAKYLEAGHAADRHPSPLTRAFEAARSRDGHSTADADFALFWDFGSLHQPPRNSHESELFRAGLCASNAWCGREARARTRARIHATSPDVLWPSLCLVQVWSSREHRLDRDHAAWRLLWSHV